MQRKNWSIGDPWNLFFGEHEEKASESGELTIEDLKVRSPRDGWDAVIITRPAEEILYYRKKLWQR